MFSELKNIRRIRWPLEGSAPRNDAFEEALKTMSEEGDDFKMGVNRLIQVIREEIGERDKTFS